MTIISKISVKVKKWPAWQAFERERKGSYGKGSFRSERNARGARGRREGDACQETIVFLVFNFYQANVKVLIGQNLIRSK